MLSKLNSILLIILSYFFIYASTLAEGYPTFAKSEINFKNDQLTLLIKPETNFKINLYCASNASHRPILKLLDSENFIFNTLDYTDICADISHNFHYGNLVIPVKFQIPDSQKSFRAQFQLSVPLCNDKDSSCVIEREILAFDSSSIKFSTIPENDFTFILALCFAFLGGVILNFMPCVLPIIAIKIASLTKFNLKSRSEIIKKSLVTIAGIICSYLVIAMVTIYLRSTGEYFGYSFYFQNSHFVILICIILMIFASSLLGRSLFNLPSRIGSQLHNASNRESLFGDFFTGCFATLMSMPCTAPFLTTAVAFAMTSSSTEVLCIFAAIGLGLSLPYILLIIAPSLLSMLPRPGRWQDSFNKILAALIYLSFFGFLYVVYTQIGFVSSLILFLLMILLKFFIEVELFITIKWILVIITAIAAFSLPFIYEHEEEQKEQIYEALWHKFAMEDINNKVKEGRVVLVDITASWCATCQINKFFVLDTPSMLEFFQKENIYLVKYDASREVSPEIKDFLQKFGRYGVPTNIIFSPARPDGILLPSLLKPGELQNEIYLIKK